MSKKDSSQQVRLFIGSALDGQPRQILEAVYARREELKQHWNRRMSWNKPQTYHLTWLFIGEVPPPKVDNIRRRAGKLLSSTPAMDLMLEGLVFWPNPQKPRTLVWQGDAQNQAVQSLEGQFRQAFPGYAEDKPFRPHITMARFRDGQGAVALPDDLQPEPQSWHIRQVSLFASVLDPAGAIHTALETWQLTES